MKSLFEKKKKKPKIDFDLFFQNFSLIPFNNNVKSILKIAKFASDFRICSWISHFNVLIKRGTCAVCF